MPRPASSRPQRSQHAHPLCADLPPASPQSTGSIRAYHAPQAHAVLPQSSAASAPAPILLHRPWLHPEAQFPRLREFHPCQKAFARLLLSSLSLRPVFSCLTCRRYRFHTARESATPHSSAPPFPCNDP